MQMGAWKLDSQMFPETSTRHELVNRLRGMSEVALKTLLRSLES